jgi:hypothetical protein
MGNSDKGETATADHAAAVMRRIGLTARPAYIYRIQRKWAGGEDEVRQGSTNG